MRTFGDENGEGKVGTGGVRTSNHLIKKPNINMAGASKSPSRSRSKVHTQIQASKKGETRSRSQTNSDPCHVEMVNFLEESEYFSLYPS